MTLSERSLREDEEAQNACYSMKMILEKVMPIRSIARPVEIHCLTVSKTSLKDRRNEGSGSRMMEEIAHTR